MIMKMGDMLRRSALHYPERPALIMQGRSVSYRAFNKRVNRLANGLMAMGLKKGDRAAVLLHNGFEFIETYFGCAKAGAVFVPINNLLKEKELSEIFNYIRPGLLILDRDYLETAEKVKKSLPFPLTSFVVGGERDGGTYEDLLEKGRDSEPEAEVLDNDTVSIFLTSGTTGRPKGVVRSHRHDFINAMNAALEIGVTRDDKALMLFPFYHITFIDHLRHFLMGNTVVIRREGGFDPEEVLSLLDKEGITMCQFVPTMINALLQGRRRQDCDLRRLRLILYAAAPMPVELLRQAMMAFPCGFAQMYGQTETGPATTILRPQDHKLEGTPEEKARLASAGRPLMNFELRIEGDDGNILPPGEVGEIVVRSEAMTCGYWELPEETAAAIRGGWLHTGDFGRLDEEGYVFIVDRKNDMIISGGKNIYPREIEEVIYTHEAVSEVLVIGVPDDYWGESVKALVVLKKGMSASEDEIIGLCKANLASYKKPKSVEFRESLPKSATGKLLKRVVREEYWQGRDRRV
jgi:acyl-CoA synthetase (AMP-forming)/AMP-acid ligase II